MSARQIHPKASSAMKTESKGAFAFRSVIKMYWPPPKEPELGALVNNLAGGLGEYSIIGRPGSIASNPVRWKDPPHRNFVNLPVITTPELGVEIVAPKALLAFSKRYGLLSSTVWAPDINPSPERERWIQQVESSASIAVITESIDRYGKEEFRELAAAKSQALLRIAWESGNRYALEAIAECAGKSLQVDVDNGALVIRVGDVWTLICMLLVRDHAAGKTAVCTSPDCPAPYFLKSRKDQKICEAVDCVSWAQRQHALKWWRENRAKTNKGGAE